MEEKHQSTSDSDTEPMTQQFDPASSTGADDAVGLLRDILFSQDRERVHELEVELDSLEDRINDKDALAATISPIVGDAIRRAIRDSRDDMIEALYPIIGQTITRAVQDAIRDLARNIDAQMQQSFTPRSVGRRIEAQARGVSDTGMVMRSALPFEVAEVFLIHRETGLLLWHISREEDGEEDNSDLISGMLTAIRDFVQDAFGRGQEGDLDVIDYGERRILIEAGQHAYLAIVIDGTEPPGYRTEMRECIIDIGYSHEGTLRNYEGDASILAPVDTPLRQLMDEEEPSGLSQGQKRLLYGAVGLLSLCIVGSCLIGWQAWQIFTTAPTPVTIVVEATVRPLPTATNTLVPPPTITNTATPTPTITPLPSPTSTSLPTATATPVPEAATAIGVTIERIVLREAPAILSPSIGFALEQGVAIEVVAVTGDWYQVRWSPRPQVEALGWVPSTSIRTNTPVPINLVTPEAS